MHERSHTSASPFKPSIGYSLQRFFCPSTPHDHHQGDSRPHFHRPSTHHHAHSNDYSSGVDEFHSEGGDGQGPNLMAYRPALVKPDYSIWQYIVAFLFDTIPRGMYRLLLLNIPAYYHSRFTHIVTEAGVVSLREIRQGIRQTIRHTKCPHEEIPKSRRFKKFEKTWNRFIESVVKEWETYNIISGLLLPATLTMLSMDPIAKDPLTRYTAMTSMLFAFLSLIYGCGYIVGFRTMHDTRKGLHWVEAWKENRFTSSIVWNDWVFISMPAIFLAWSLCMIVLSFATFLWGVGTVEDSNKERLLKRNEAAIPRLIASVILAIGMFYLVRIIYAFRWYSTLEEEELQQIKKSKICHPQYASMPIRQPEVPIDTHPVFGIDPLPQSSQGRMDRGRGILTRNRPF